MHLEKQHFLYDKILHEKEALKHNFEELKQTSKISSPLNWPQL